MRLRSFSIIVGVMTLLFASAGLQSGPAQPSAPPQEKKDEPKVSAKSAPTPAATDSHAAKKFEYFSFLSDPHFSSIERILLFVVLGVAFAGLAYAWMLMGQINAADKGTLKMQQIAAAIREGADAYLYRQLSTVFVLIVVLVVILFWSKASTSKEGFSDPFALGRALSFLVGAVFSAMVGFVGMRLATTGNLRVAAAAREGFGKALMLGYRTGTVTGMLTDGLGLLGGTLIFMAYGEHAYEALLGFGFGGTLLALFMRVGGGIYTKAADVVLTWSVRSKKTFPKMIHETLRPSPITWVTTLVTVPVWPPTFLNRTK